MYINFKEQAIIVVKVHHHQGLNGFHYVDEGNQSMDIGGEVVRRREGR